MAIAFIRHGIHSRAKGHSAVAAAAYRAGERLYDERTGETHDFTKRKDVVFKEILLPEGAGLKYGDRHTLWNQTEAAENRRDAQVAKEMVIALPKELSRTDNIELAKRFVYELLVQHGVPADICIHDKDDGNPHAHVLYTTRRLERDGFSKYKARDLNPGFAKGRVVKIDVANEKYRDFMNAFFVEKGLDLRADLNHIVPEKHQGRVRNGAHYLKETNDEIRTYRKEIALSDVKNFINLVSLKNSTFTKRDIEKLLFKTVLNNPNQDFAALVERVMSHSDVIELGLGEDGKTYFTTRQHYVAENRLFSSVERLEANTKHQINENVSTELRSFGLREEQQHAINHVLQSGAIAAVVGKPGAGKSYMLKALKAVYQTRNFELIGTAVSDKVTKALQADSGLNSYTLASLNYRLQKGYLKLNSRSVIVVDEAGMVDFSHYGYLIDEVKRAKAKLVLVGDPNQLKAIGKGDIFRGIIERIGFYSMDDIQRQRDAGDRRASLELSRGNVEYALSHYEQKDALHWSTTKDFSISLAAENWAKGIDKDNLDHSIMLAFTRKSVAKLNNEARARLIEKGLLNNKESLTYDAIRGERQVFKDALHKLESKLMATPKTEHQSGKIEIAVGERLIFSKKHKKMGLDNGDMGTVTSVQRGAFEVKLDNGNTVTIEDGKYQHFDYAYALTVHKAQGATVENAHVVVDSKFWDRYLSLVAMTRHKNNLCVYASKALHQSKEQLIRTLSRSPIKDNLIDWPLNYALRHGFNPDSSVGKAVNRMAGIAHKIKDKWLYVVNYEAYLKRQEWAVSIEEKQTLRDTAKRVSDYKEHQRLVIKYFKEASQYPSQQEAPKELQDKLYEAGLLRDKASFELLSHEKEKLEKDEFKGITLEKVEKGAKRYQDHQTFKEKANRAPAVKGAEKDIKQPDHVKKAVNEYIVALKELEKSSNFTQAKKELKAVVSKILATKGLMNEIKKVRPKAARAIQSRAKSLGLYRDLDRGLDR